MIKRRKTRTVTVGKVKIGSAHPIVVQSMTKTDTADISSTVREIRKLEKAGCEIVRVAVKDMKAAEAISQIKKEISIPLVADIHFDHRLALECIKRGADKIRLNPGNIHRDNEINGIIDRAGEKGIPIRIGVNSGSLSGDKTGKSSGSGAMVRALFKYTDKFRKRAFEDIVISVKSSDVASTVEAYEKVAGECDYPMHVGVTAAGLPSSGIIKSSIGIGALLLKGIGDTVRVSLTGDPVKEVEAARCMLQAVGARHFGHDIISCPTCGRCQVDLVGIVAEIDKKLKEDARYLMLDTGKPLMIAVMGCEVNGPGEAKEADIGIAFGKSRGAIFKNGKIVKTVRAETAVSEMIKIIRSVK